MSWLLAFLGFAALIILHEAGHFAAAKAVGMRVERFSLFFGRPIASFRRGETEYGVGWIPLGGYVRITGMNPREELAPEIAHRAYYRQKVWKRIVVILAGPVVNVVVAFVIIWALLVFDGQRESTRLVSSEDLRAPAADYLQPGDRIVSVDGASGDVAAISRAVSSHRCAGTPVDGCRATTPARVVVERDGSELTFEIYPRYDAARGIERTRLGFTYDTRSVPIAPLEAASMSASGMWNVTELTVKTFARIFDPAVREQLSGPVGSYEATRQSIEFDTTQALSILALISLSLAIINLFPFLPLDGGHIFWAVAEKVRGRAIPFVWMERASAVGFVLVIALFLIGLTNDIGVIQDGGDFLRPR